MLHSLWLPRGCINSKHCLPLCATGLEVGDNSVEKMLFSKTILSHSTMPYLGYFLCILVVRFLMRGHLSRVSKAYQTTKGKLHPWRETTHFQTFAISCKLPFVLSTTELGLCVVTIFLPYSLPIGGRNVTTGRLLAFASRITFLKHTRRRGLVTNVH